MPEERPKGEGIPWATILLLVGGGYLVLQSGILQKLVAPRVITRRVLPEEKAPPPTGPGLTIRKPGFSAYIPIDFGAIFESIFGRKPTPEEQKSSLIASEVSAELPRRYGTIPEIYMAPYETQYYIWGEEPELIF